MQKLTDEEYVFATWIAHRIYTFLGKQEKLKNDAAQYLDIFDQTMLLWDGKDIDIRWSGYPLGVLISPQGESLVLNLPSQKYNEDLSKELSAIMKNAIQVISQIVSQEE